MHDCQQQPVNHFFDPAYASSLMVPEAEDLRSDTIDVLNDYQGHGLTDLKHAALMDRIDTKYLLSIQELPNLLMELKESYSVLEIDGRRLFTYHNTYFDTVDHRFYLSHHQGKLERYKVRHRHYVDNHLGFLEVKLKNNKGRTIKTRIPQSDPRLDSPEVASFLATELKGDFQDLISAQWGSYQRTSLANEASGERITLDLNLTFQSAEDGTIVHLPHLLIAELKQGRHCVDSPFARLMSRLGVRSKSFSKYCIGCSMVTPGLKANRFKPQLLAVKKIH